MASDRARMADAVAAAKTEFSAAAAGDGSLSVSPVRPRARGRRAGTDRGARECEMTDLSTALQEPWPDLRMQREAVGLGMWFFLASEVMFFAALFCGYAI